MAGRENCRNDERQDLAAIPEGLPCAAGLNRAISGRFRPGRPRGSSESPIGFIAPLATTGGFDSHSRELWPAYPAPTGAGEGAVTRTEFGRLNIGEPASDSGRGGGSPRPEGFLAEDPERRAGCEMALDGGVNG